MQSSPPSALLARAVLAAADAMFCQDLDGAVLSWNRSAELLYGFTAGEMVGQVPDGLAADGPRQELASAQARAGAGERVARFDSWHRHRDGTRLAVAVSVVCLRDDTDRVDAVATTVTDVRALPCVLDDPLGCARFRHTPPVDATVDLRQVTDDVKASLGRTIRELNGNVEIGPLPQVRFDAELLQNLLQNLLSNALAHRSPGRPPQVIVTATQAEGQVTLRVDDNGMRLHSRDPRAGSVAQQIVKLAGGRIWADESPLGGARLSCTLPAAGDSDSARRAT